MRVVSLGMVVAMILSVVGFMPEKTVKVAEDEYTYTVFCDDFSDPEESKIKWTTAPNIQNGQNVIGLGAL